MNQITKETRLESFLQISPNTRYSEILNILGSNEMTARQITQRLGKLDGNYCKPRLTELVHKGILEVVGKAYDKATERNVAVYRRA